MCRLAAQDQREREPERAPRSSVGVTGSEARLMGLGPGSVAGGVLTHEVGSDREALEVVDAE